MSFDIGTCDSCNWIVTIYDVQGIANKCQQHVKENPKHITFYYYDTGITRYINKNKTVGT